MATVLTGRDLSLIIDGDTYDAQTISTTFTYVNNREVLETLDGPLYKTLTFTYSLDVNMYSDWGGEANPGGGINGLCAALANAALTAPDTPVDFTITVVGPDSTGTVTGKVFPEVPAVTAEGSSASTVTVNLTGDRNTVPTITFA
jgi:hypothetical protein